MVVPNNKKKALPRPAPDTVKLDIYDPEIYRRDGRPRSGGRADKLPRPRRGEPYLGGPIPLGWLERAAALPGRAFHLGAALWFVASCEKRQPTVRLSLKTRKRFGLSSDNTYYRALAALRGAGLISIAVEPGRRLVITILSAPA
jgi:hypothetical protein